MSDSRALIPVPRRSTGISVQRRMQYEMSYARWERAEYEAPAQNPQQERARRKRWLFLEPQGY